MFMNKKDYAEMNRRWLAEKAAEDSVDALSNGVYYKVLESGDPAGRRPSASSVVTVRYEGRTIDGRVFDSSRDEAVAPAFRLRDLIGGWIVALQRMRPGDRWEVYIPAEQGYGRQSQPGIPGGSTLVFDIELVSVN